MVRSSLAVSRPVSPRQVENSRSVIRSTTRYGDVEFCSSVQLGRIFACQFHPERSGMGGLSVYGTLHRALVANEAIARS